VFACGPSTATALTTTMFVIEDAIHAENNGHFASFADAVAELRRRATMPWDVIPNVAPCVSWRTCGREYVILEFDDLQVPWKALRRIPALNVSARGIEWMKGFEESSGTDGA
jgi:hypothetical protein